MAGFTGWHPIDSFVCPQQIDATSTTQELPLGTVVRANHTDYGYAEFIYLKGVASTAQGDAVTFDEAGVTARSTSNAKGRVGVAMSANIANQYGFYCVYGKVPCEVGGSFADNGVLYLTGTAGHLDDADAAGDLVAGAIGRGAEDDPNTGQAWVELNYPFVNDSADD
tara:strand:+ start:2064 stop:2564 length:501 start_codon:yes stop_codon:yes gene_type:complete